DRVAEEEACGRARRPPPERLGEDDCLRLLGPAEAGRARLDATALGRADPGRPAAAIHDGRRAGARRPARRPLRARARGQAAARPGGAAAARIAARSPPLPAE